MWNLLKIQMCLKSIKIFGHNKQWVILACQVRIVSEESKAWIYAWDLRWEQRFHGLDRGFSGLLSPLLWPLWVVRHDSSSFQVQVPSKYLSIHPSFPGPRGPHWLGRDKCIWLMLKSLCLYKYYTIASIFTYLALFALCDGNWTLWWESQV